VFDRFYRSWDLVKASASVLRQDKELLLFPLISSGALILVALCFLIPAAGLGALDGLERDNLSAGHYLLAFLFYFSQYFVIFFFNTALVGAAMIRLEGGDPTVADGLRIAYSKIGAILGYAAIAATVGLILRSLQERAGFLGRIVVGLVGMAWTLATFLVVPVLVARDVGPLDAVKESVELLKRTWGENLAGNVGINLAFGLLTTAVVILGIALVVGVADDQHPQAHVGGEQARHLVELRLGFDLQLRLAGVEVDAIQRDAALVGQGLAQLVGVDQHLARFHRRGFGDQQHGGGEPNGDGWQETVGAHQPENRIVSDVPQKRNDRAKFRMNTSVIESRTARPTANPTSSGPPETR